jgi:hypothetical protein
MLCFQTLLFCLLASSIQFIVGDLVVGFVLLGLGVLSLALFGLYAGARKTVFLLRLYGVCCLAMVAICLAGLIRGLVGVYRSEHYVDQLTDEEITDKFELPRTRDEIVSDLLTFYWGYGAPHSHRHTDTPNSHPDTHSARCAVPWSVLCSLLTLRQGTSCFRTMNAPVAMARLLLCCGFGSAAVLVLVVVILTREHSTCCGAHQSLIPSACCLHALVDSAVWSRCQWWAVCLWPSACCP